ncbi:maestro heat-like repeat-containing protein family member 7 [Choloepus didactylus]|uniref:maestro heat-like repeat-containing protein family member 7 n=1 Tax=Choloepus didactylus TaxID=27675 RepID=UPI00189E58C2|nr:maestro heat-like repeat-containing protein family member 7 [Choloepus didactylus]
MWSDTQARSPAAPPSAKGPLGSSSLAASTPALQGPLWGRGHSAPCSRGAQEKRVPWIREAPRLRQSETEAYQFIMEYLSQDQQPEVDNLKFLKAVETLSGAVRAQGNGNMNDYYPLITLTERIEALILQESTEFLTSSVRQQAMLCIVALSQVKPSFHESQKLDLVNAGIYSVFSLPLIMPSPDWKDTASLYMQTVQALDEMLQALMMEDMNPNMLMLQNFLEIILPWLTLSEKVHEQTRALGTISRLLRFICKFPQLSHMMEFLMSGKLMGILGLFCMDSNQEISAEASEALHYLFTILALQRSLKQKTETILKNLQKSFRGEWFAHVQDLILFFGNYLTPEERADVIMVSMEAMTNTSRYDSCTASNMLKLILKDSIPEIGKVPEIIQYIYYNMMSITETTAQMTMQKILHLMAQTYTDEVILTLIEMEDQSHKGVHKPWEILASFPKGYEVIMEHLLQRLTPHKRPRGQESSQRTEISPLIATRALHELLLEPSRRTEVQTFFPSLFMTLLFQVSFLVVEGRHEVIHEEKHVAEWVDPVRSTVEALKTLMWSSGYGEYVSYIHNLGTWELLMDPERHFEGVTLLARAMVTKKCWHNGPICRLIFEVLHNQESSNHLTALTFVTELLRCPEVAAIVDEVATRILAKWFHCEEPAPVKLLLQVAVTFAKHGNMVRQLRILQPYVLNCCYSTDIDIVMETFLVLKCLIEHLTWQRSSSFFIQLAFMLRPFFDEESEHLRLSAFEIYERILAKTKRKILVFPLKHQVLNLIVLLVFHLKDENVNVAQICRSALCHTANILGWSRLKVVFAEKDEWTILSALLEQETNKALWFLKQSVGFFKSPQAPIRQVAVWFAGQIIQVLDVEDPSEVEEAYTGASHRAQNLLPSPAALLCAKHHSRVCVTALRYMRKDPDPTISCLATQIFYVLEAKEKLLASFSTSCFCRRRLRKHYF